MSRLRPSTVKFNEQGEAKYRLHIVEEHLGNMALCQCFCGFPVTVETPSSSRGHSNAAQIAATRMVDHMLKAHSAKAEI